MSQPSSIGKCSCGGFSFWLSLAMAVGCNGPKFAPVSGTVTLHDKPLAEAFVIFEPLVGSPDQISKAETDEVGHFVLSGVNGRDGCLVGEHYVRITTIPPDAMEDERSPLPKDKVPIRYQRDPLTFEVPEDGTVAANFNLTRN